MDNNDLKQTNMPEKALQDDSEAKKPSETAVEMADESLEKKTEEKTGDASEKEQQENYEPKAEKSEKKEALEEKKTKDAPEKKETPRAAISTKSMKGKWYIVHTYSGHENKVAKTLIQRVAAMGFSDRIFDAIVPTRETIRIRSGKKENIKEKIFPGYILVNMDLTDESWILVRTTPGVTSFVGAENKPTPIRDEEVEAIVQFVDRKEPVYKAQFSVGEAVKINDGPFSDFLGTIESIDQEKGKVKVLVSIFGRETPVELDFLQVTKI